MTITTQICKRIYQGDGETRVWELDFPVLSAADVKILVTSANGTETEVTTGHEVNLLQHTVTYPTVASGMSALATGQRITLLRVTPLTQTINLTQQGVLDAEELENGYDKLTLHVQELSEQVQRSIKYAPSSGKTEADAATFLAELQAAQTTALNGALASVEETKTALQQSLAAEETARQNADSSLSQQLQTLSGLVSQQDSAITAEATARQNADTALQSAKQDVISDLSTIRSGASAGATALQPATAASIYLSQTNAASTYVALSQKAAANGVASLDGNTQVPLAQLPVDNTLSLSSENPIQNKAVTAALNENADAIEAINDELGTNPPWTKPESWIDIRSGALPNSVYFLVGHSADYATYPIFAWKASVESGGTYDVYVDGIKQLSAVASGSEATLTWSTLALASGYDVTYPAALRTHIVRFTPTDNTKKFTNINTPATKSYRDGALWAHFNIDYDINGSDIFGSTTTNQNLLEAVTAKDDVLKLNSGAARLFASLKGLKTIPILDFENRNVAIAYILYQIGSGLKKAHIRNLKQSGSVTNSEGISNTKIEELVFENSSVCWYATLLGSNNSALKKLPQGLYLSATSGELKMQGDYSGLQDTFIDLTAQTALTRLTIDGKNSPKNLGIKGIVVSSDAPFSHATSPQIDIKNNGLDRAALITLFNSLPTVTDSQVCNIAGCSGASDLDTTDLAIATAKGWTVTR